MKSEFTFRKNLPHSLKVILRLFRYKAEWKKQFREISIKQQQLTNLKNINTELNSLILFLVPGANYDSGKDEISGGMLSVFSIFKETQNLEETLNAKVIMATLKDNHLLLKYSNFKNDVTIISWDQLINNFKNLDKLLIHIPEMYTEWFLSELNENELKWLSHIRNIQINILNQNIHLMPPTDIIYKLKNQFKVVTITTAHHKYCTPSFQQIYQVPLHLLSVWVSPEQYEFKEYAEKDNLLVISPDPHPLKEEIIKSISKSIPELKIQVIQNLTYEEYKSLICRAKWSLTFGEGLDAYFVEAIFSGAISFAVYNEDFFTKDFEDLNSVFSNYSQLSQMIVSEINKFDDIETYKKIQNELYTLCASLYSYKNYQKNIEQFYQGNYTFK